MKQKHVDYQVAPYPKFRRIIAVMLCSFQRMPMIHGLIEVDVTRARAYLREHKAKTGESLSFTAFLIACLAQAVDENPSVQACRKGNKHLVVFDDVDVATAIKRNVAGQKQPIVYIVNIEPMREVRTLEGYCAVVLGAPLYMFRWHKDALHFLTRHRAALTQRPVAIFTLGPFHVEEKEYQEVRRQLDKELAKFSWLIPQAIAIFCGKFDPQKLTFPYNLMPALKNMPASDVRDRAVIRAWASDLAEQFQPALCSKVSSIRALPILASSLEP